MIKKQYAERDPEALDEAGGYYIRNVSAMTSEGLHVKSAIAAELGYRDMIIDELASALSDADDMLCILLGIKGNPEPGSIGDRIRTAIKRAKGE